MESNRILVQLMVKDGHDFQEVYDAVICKMMHHEPIVDGCELYSVYVPGNSPKGIIESIREDINKKLDEIEANL